MVYDLIIIGGRPAGLVKELNISKKAIERFFRLIKKVLYTYSLIELKKFSKAFGLMLNIGSTIIAEYQENTSITTLKKLSSGLITIKKTFLRKSFSFF